MSDLDPRREQDTVTVFERSREGRRAFVAPPAGVPEPPVSELLPASQLRERPAALPEISEPELVRHYVTLSSKNFHLDEGFYPLGSCTMKHNPKLHERVAALPRQAVPDVCHARRAAARSCSPSAVMRTPAGNAYFY